MHRKALRRRRKKGHRRKGHKHRRSAAHRARQRRGSAALKLKRGKSHRHHHHHKGKAKQKARRSSAPAYGGGLVDRVHALERETGFLAEEVERAKLRHARSAFSGNRAMLLEDESDEYTDESDDDLWEHLSDD